MKVQIKNLIFTRHCANKEDIPTLNKYCLTSKGPSFFVNLRHRLTINLHKSELLDQIKSKVRKHFILLVDPSLCL